MFQNENCCVATFSTTGLAVGNTLSFDITALFNGAISSGSTSLGLRLQTAPGTTTNGGAWTFDNFRLTTDNQTSQPVPEPLTIAGAVVAATSLGVMRRKQQKQS
ncbi:MAG TPA: PEP-CTERM sorting domain-containing protein [Leptolyngbyaceae cyanobacterium M33_DOE_097]|nr:PEP-CTERM sorting domain-containing protein [Leptolyngbyaceae cyanobacterium M33_DOE_097]